jgi:guanylate kinase
LPEAVSIFILPPSREELERRLRRRSEADNELRRRLTGEEISVDKTEAILQRRLREASREIENYSQYDYILVNEKVEPAIDILQSIVKAERLKRLSASRRPEDEVVLATARLAERPHMMEQVQTILATFDLSRSHATTE